jgi:hypothetical protein
MAPALGRGFGGGEFQNITSLASPHCADAPKSAYIIIIGTERMPRSTTSAVGHADTFLTLTEGNHACHE